MGEDLFGMAAIDRSVDHSINLEFDGDSYRANTRLA
jgi:hypothetical protein